MPASDYKRFLNFLRKHECFVSFQRFRSGRGTTESTQPTGITDL
jgi:hypothetical protein